MIKNLLFNTIAISLLTTSAMAQKDYSKATTRLNDNSTTQNWTMPEKNTTNNESLKSTTISDESGYYFNNAYLMNGGSGSYNTDPLKTWPNGAGGGLADTTFSQAEQFIPNTASLTLDSISFLGMAMNGSTPAVAVVQVQTKDFALITYEFVTVSAFNKYTVVLSNPVNLTDSFFIMISPASDADSLAVGVTNDYAELTPNPLPYQGNGFFVEYNTGTFAFENAYYPGDGGGDWIIWPNVTYTVEDVTASVACLSTNDESVDFTSQNEGLLTNPVWNYNAWAAAQGAPSSAGYFYTQVNIAEQTLADSNQTAGYNYVFPTPGLNNVEYTERIYPWSTPTNIDNTTSIVLDICAGVDELSSNINVNAYPNPASDQITFELNSSKDAILNVYDLTGKLIITKTLTSTINNIDVSMLNNGFYMYNLATATKKATTGNFVINR